MEGNLSASQKAVEPLSVNMTQETRGKNDMNESHLENKVLFMETTGESAEEDGREEELAGWSFHINWKAKSQQNMNIVNVTSCYT